MGNAIYIGSTSTPSYVFRDSNIFSIDVNQSVALVGQNLGYDTFSAVVADDYENVTGTKIFRPSGADRIRLSDSSYYCIDVGSGYVVSGLVSLSDGTPVWYYQNDVLVGKFFLNSVTRTGKNQYRLECVSIIGTLDKLQHDGGVYDGDSFTDVLEDILDGTGAWYSVTDEVAALTVSGWLPRASVRENLYQLLFAYGVNIVRRYDGGLLFTFIHNTPSGSIISDQITFDEGDVVYNKPYSGVEITEHVYTEPQYGIEIGTEEEPYLVLDSDSKIVILDNTSGTALINETIYFQEPIVPDSILSEWRGAGALSFTITNKTVNSVTLSGKGVLVGVPYAHAKKIRYTGASGASRDKILEITDCTLVNSGNSSGLLSRLAAFYCQQTSLVRGSFKYTDEQCGKAYVYTDRFGAQNVSYLSKIKLSVSSFNKATCELYANYTPPDPGAKYSHVEMIVPQEDTYTGTWTVPAGVTEFMAVLIGGGTGGSSGYAGARGKSVSGDAWYGGEGGEGGEGGAGGSGGMIYTVTASNVTPGDAYSWELGVGGTSGNHGTATTFSTWSSASGWRTPVYEPFSGNYYALDGTNGLPGGQGGARKIVNGNVFNWVTDGEDVAGNDGSIYSGGHTGESLHAEFENGLVSVQIYGGNGAGAAIGLDRKTHTEMNGGDAPEPNLPYINGATAGGHTLGTKPAKPAKQAVYGSGGIGGNGGAGGAGESNVLIQKDASATGQYQRYRLGYGYGSDGGDGGDGGDGCIIIYY